MGCTRSVHPNFKHPHHPEGDSMTPTERSESSPASTMGLLATLRASLRPNGTRAPRIALLTALTLSALTLSAAPALAAAPEVPTAQAPTEVKATTAIFHGTLNPGNAGGPFELAGYQFVYRASASECEGAGQLETTEVQSAGLGEEAVEATVESLKENTKYSVCLIARNVAKTESATSTPPVAFETALTPEAPLTEKATLVTATTATFNGEPNPKAEATVGYDFTYNTNGSCEGSTTTPVPPAKLKAAAKVATPLTLVGSSEYTFCLAAFNSAGETTLGAPLKFKTPAAAPEVIPGSTLASNLSTENASVEARVNPERQETTYHFEYAETEAMTGAKSFGEASLPGTGETQAAGPVEVGGGLHPGTVYYYRVVASNLTGITKGPVEQFTTLVPQAPVIQEEEALEITQTTAQALGKINPEFQNTLCLKWQFVDQEAFEAHEYENAGTTNCGPEEIGGGGEFERVGSGPMAPLKPNTVYHFRVLASNASGEVPGPDETFRSLPYAPSVTTEEPSAVTAGSATISGSVNPGSSGPDSATTYEFQYGTTTAYGEQFPLAPGTVGEGETEVPETAALTGLQPGTTYHYRIIATNFNNAVEPQAPQSSYGVDRTFTTPATPPTLTAVGVAAVTQSTATITGTLDPRGSTTRYELQLGTVPNLLGAVASGQVSAVTPVSLTVGSLTPGTVYYYRLTATSAEGATESQGAFTTAAAPAGEPSPFTVALIPFTPVSQIAAKEEAENKKNGKPLPLTNKQKLEKALKVCHKDKKKSKRTKCERAAHKKYPTAKKKG